MRKWLAANVSQQVADATRIIYGGSGEYPKPHLCCQSVGSVGKENAGCLATGCVLLGPHVPAPSALAPFPLLPLYTAACLPACSDRKELR